MEDVLQDFILAGAELSILASLQRQLVDVDINATAVAAQNAIQRRTVERKRDWQQRWIEQVQQRFLDMPAESRPTLWASDDADFMDALTQLQGDTSPAKRGLILLELTAFEPYSPFEAKEFRKGSSLHLKPHAHRDFLRDASRRLGFPEQKGYLLRKNVTAAFKAISGYHQKLAFGLLAGVGLGAVGFGLAITPIAAAIGGAMGLYGAAAISAGLAALGGSMAMGSAMIVGGGAILGLGVGGTAGKLVADITAHGVTIDAAKMEVVLREFILTGRDTARMQEILIAQSRSIQALREELITLRTAGDMTNDRIRELEKAIHYLEQALKRNERWHEHGN